MRGPDDRLPGVRVLAHDLAINQNTVLRVYERLTMEGLLERKHGDGTFVWRVAAIGEEGVVGPWSTARRFRVSPTVPVLESEQPILAEAS